MTLIERLQAKQAERDKITDRIARMLWESGPMTDQWDGDGAPPDWDAITTERAAPAPDKSDEDACERHDAFVSYWLDTWHRAEAIQGLDADQSMELARILLAQADRQRKDMELDLWRKIERAAGYERGSLTGEPGVPQRVFI